MAAPELPPPDPSARQEPVPVPHTDLSPELLRSVIESVILREGTDYGLRELSLEEKVGRILRQLQQGRAQIVFDPNADSVTIVAR
jgi:uncharacterized protein YheU (UPF0270 family)